MNNIKEIETEEELNKYLDDDKVTMAVFYKPDCPFCVKFDKTVKNIHKKYKTNQNTKIIKIQKDENNKNKEKMCNKHEIISVPTVLIYKNGELRKRYDKYNEKERNITNIKAEIQKAINT